MGPAFDRSEEFALDKPGFKACPKLGADDRCRIHDRLEPEGFRGCVIYDCLGAGQRVVQELYASRSWREDPELLPQMWQAVTTLRGVHQMILLLTEAEKLPLSPDERSALYDTLGELDPLEGWEPDGLACSGNAAVARAGEFLRSLRRHFPS